MKEQLQKEELKRRCALEALQYIKNGMVIGLGGGSTIAYLVSYLAEKKMDVRIVTPSYQTANLCIKHHLQVVPTWSISHVDIAFDGCNEVDMNLYALKSGGAIHTNEKLIASMADDYVLLVDESKVSDTLTFHDSVALEIVPDSIAYIKKQIEQLHGRFEMRTSSSKDGYVVSDYGNFIADAYFEHVEDIEELNRALTSIVGIVETSLFVHLVTFVLCVNETGVRVIKKA